MAQSMNTKVDYSVKATSYHSLAVYGDMMIGDKAVEFYNERNVEDYVQIPWEEIDHVAASVVFGKNIVRFAVMTKSSGNFSFSTRDNKATLRAMRPYLGDENLVRSPNIVDVFKLGMKRLFHRG